VKTLGKIGIGVVVGTLLFWAGCKSKSAAPQFEATDIQPARPSAEELQLVEIDIQAAAPVIKYFDELDWNFGYGVIALELAGAKSDVQKLIDRRERLMASADNAARGLPGLDPANSRRISPKEVKCRFHAINVGLVRAKDETERMLKAATALRKAIGKPGEITGLDMFRLRTQQGSEIENEFEESRARIGLVVMAALEPRCDPR
jgi:hypothetical protein